MHTSVLAIDPGPVNTAYALVRRKDRHLYAFGICNNQELLQRLEQLLPADVAIEMIASYGMAVGAEVFETCVWIGRIMQHLESCGADVSRIFRREVKIAMCGSMKAKDANVRQAIIDSYQTNQSNDVTKKGGPLYKVSKDAWAAIGVALTQINKDEHDSKHD
jgi:Holliday junction resolvasome RuvABC endonuclease subunit